MALLIGSFMQEVSRICDSIFSRSRDLWKKELIYDNMSCAFSCGEKERNNFCKGSHLIIVNSL